MFGRSVLLTPMYYGKECVVRTPNGKEYRRVVRYSRADGLYVVIATRKYFEYEMEIGYKWKENEHGCQEDE